MGLLTGPRARSSCTARPAWARPRWSGRWPARVGADGFAVLWGTGLRFGAAEAPYLPLVMAFEAWLTAAGEEERQAVLGTLPAAVRLLPSLGAGTLTPAVRGTLMPVVDALLAGISRHRPVLLVVDDVHWADPATLDTLTYLVAGARGRVGMLMTMRDEQKSPGVATARWLADVRRFPTTCFLALDRMGREDTEAQLTALLGSSPHPGLVHQVQTLTGGNPYLTELLVRDVPADAESLPGDLPAELREALLVGWHEVSAPTREVLQVLAVAGRPVQVDALAEAVDRSGTGHDVGGALEEARERGLVLPGPGRVWFRHPLLAETLMSRLTVRDARPVHAAWVDVLERRSARGSRSCAARRTSRCTARPPATTRGPGAQRWPRRTSASDWGCTTRHAGTWGARARCGPAAPPTRGRRARRPHSTTAGHGRPRWSRARRTRCGAGAAASSSWTRGPTRSGSAAS